MPTVTEKQAANLWCPMARVLFSVVNGPTLSFATVNRASIDSEEKMTTCIGSRCAMWRWQYEASPKRIRCKNEEAKAEPPRNVNETASGVAIPDSYVFEPADCDTLAVWREPAEEAQQRSKGYCGLAGPVR